MNYKGFLPVATIALLSLSACMKDSPNPSDVTKEINVKASIEGLSGVNKPNTRATNTSWENGDAIGIFMKNNGTDLSLSALAINAKYITSGSDAFTPADEDNKIELPFNKSVDFIAYYPYTDELDDRLNYKIDVSDQTNLPKIDLLYSQNLDNINSTSVDLTFQHQLVKMIFNIVSNPETDLTVLSMGITNMNTRADFSLEDGTINNESNPETVLLNLNESKTAGQAILLPTSVLSNNSLIIKFENTSYSIDLSEIDGVNSFDKTTRYTFNLTLKQGEDPTLESVSKSIEDWVDGPHKDITVDEDASDEESGNNESGEGENEGEGGDEGGG
ncbi:MAG: fimbrillin family protein, partial [Dysgonamonadaceae bacterium]|nr:fimbrillin family protein [Dysgonamonadaceae bacterium]